MSCEKGMQWTCDRCGEIKFIKFDVPMQMVSLSAALSSGWERKVQESPEGWVKVPGYGDFCTQCASAYKMWIEDYMRNAPKTAECSVTGQWTFIDDYEGGADDEID